jgi:3-hydroxyacyl-CoA dehydrogenase
MTQPIDYAVEGDVAVLTIDSPPVNALGAAVRIGVAQGLETARGDDAVKAVVIMAAGKLFSGGADITEFNKAMADPDLRALEAIVEAFPKPVVAALRGTAYGGGLELPMCCHYRVGTPSARMALPEVALGLLPGAGGTQRLPRLVGPKKALEMITSGAPISGADAAQAGLLDALVGEDTLRADAIAFARKVVAEGRPLKKVRDLAEKLEAGRDGALFADFRKANARKFRGMDAPEACIQSVENAVNLPFDDGIKAERDMFETLMLGEQSAAQRHAFFAERQVWKVPDLTDDIKPLPIRKVGVIGAGTMGGGISMNFVNAGIPVTIIETNGAALERGLGVVRKNYERSVKSGRLTMADVDSRMGMFNGQLDLSALADCDLVIEAVFETMEVKRDVFGRLSDVVRPDAILASNTSYLDIDEIAATVSHPERFLGLHFFSPANVMKLLEVVRGAKTDKAVLATAMQLAKKIGKIGVLVGNAHGFVGNRMLIQRTREAGALILEGALPWEVDRVLVEFGMAMGPFGIGDLAGLDLGWTPETSTSSTVREILNEHGRRGQKTGAGFYDYDENRNPTPSALVEKIIKDFAATKGIPQRDISEQEILERCLYPMVNEGAKILEEGKAIRASDIDAVWLNGYGWPRHKGGPMFWGEQVGLARILERMKAYEAQGKPEFKPSALLERLVAEGKGFKDV